MFPNLQQQDLDRFPFDAEDHKEYNWQHTPQEGGRSDHRRGAEKESRVKSSISIHKTLCLIKFDKWTTLQRVYKIFKN